MIGFVPQNIKLNLIGNYHLLVIGIDEYANPHQYPNLHNAEKDADNFAEALEKKYTFKNVKRLKSKEATRETIIRQIETFNFVNKNDNIVIFFAGHGDYQNPIGYSNQKPVGYIVPYDASVDTKAGFISYSTLIEHLSFIPARHILLIVDCCYGGLLLKYRDTIHLKTEGEYQKQEKFISRKFMSSGHIEKVPDGVMGMNSPFMETLLNILQINEAPELPVDALHQKMRDEINEKQKEMPLPMCSPLSIAGDDGGDMILRIENAETEEIKAYERAERSKSKYDLEFFMDNFKESLLRKEVVKWHKNEHSEQKQEWKKALKIKTYKSINDYLDSYPNEFFSTDAKMKLAEIEEKIEKSKVFYQKAVEIKLTAIMELGENGVLNPSIESKYKASIDYLTKAIKVYQDFADAYAVRADLNRSLKNYPQAIADFTEELRIEFDTSTYCERAFTKLTLGLSEEALSDFDAIIEREPNNLELYSRRAFAKFSVGRQKEALKDFNDIIQRTPNNANLYSSRAQLRNNMADTEGALEDYLKAFALNSDDVFIASKIEEIKDKLKK